MAMLDALLTRRLPHKMSAASPPTMNIIDSHSFMFFTLSLSDDVFVSSPSPLAMAKGDGEETSTSSLSDKVKNMKLWLSIIFIVGGLASLIIGGNLLVNSASSIAIQLGVSQSIIALTIVSIGTSLPELAASAMAARKGDNAMALGNVVGSAVFNVFFVLGVSATIAPLSLGNITTIDVATLVLASCLFWLFSRTHFEVKKWEGAILLVVQILYYIYLVTNATTEIN
jgi:Ca2+/Na+ antiporter